MERRLTTKELAESTNLSVSLKKMISTIGCQKALKPKKLRNSGPEYQDSASGYSMCLATQKLTYYSEETAY
jgi:hypothetical protein